MNTHSTEWHAERLKGLGGSDANILMGGDQAAILRLWEEKIGQREGDDLSWVLPVQIGIATEALNLRWLAHISGFDITTDQTHVQHKEYPWMRCNPDGLTAMHLVEAKHVGQFQDMDKIVQKYMPQLHHNMACCEKSKSLLSIFKGTMDHYWYEVAFDEWYGADLIDRERVFWECVLDKTPPFDMPAVAPPVQPDKWRVVSFEGNNDWAFSALDWLENKTAAKKFELAAKNLKTLVEPDVGEAFGHKIEIKRSKAGALTIKESKS